MVVWPKEHRSVEQRSDHNDTRTGEERSIDEETSSRMAHSREGGNGNRKAYENGSLRASRLRFSTPVEESKARNLIKVEAVVSTCADVTVPGYPPSCRRRIIDGVLLGCGHSHSSLLYMA